MKKWITMLLPFCLLFGMTACSTGKTEASGITEQNSENQMSNEKTEITLAESSETFAKIPAYATLLLTIIGFRLMLHPFFHSSGKELQFTA